MGSLLSKPQGANDRWTEEETGWVKVWLEDQRQKQNPLVVFFDDFRFETKNPVDYYVQDPHVGSKLLKIRSYAQKSKIARDDPGYKGIMFFHHGFGDYAARAAHHA